MANPYAPPGSRPPDAPRGLPQRLDPRPPDGPRPPEAQRPPVDPEAARAALRWCGRFALLVLAGMVVLLLGLPWGAASLLFFVAATATGVAALRSCLRAHLGSGVPAALVMGLVAVLVLALVEVVVVISWNGVSELQRCQEQAITTAAQDACAARTGAQLDAVLSER